jgi:hypothetical protein
LPRTVTVVSPAGEQDAGRGKRLAAAGDLHCDPGHDLADVACLAFYRVAENVRRHAGLARHPGGGFERQLGCRDQARLHSGQMCVARFDRLAAAAFEDVEYRRR